MTVETHRNRQNLATTVAEPARRRSGSWVKRRLLAAAALVALPIAILVVGTGSASAATIGGDYYSASGGCLIISSTPYGLSWQQQLEGVGTMTSYLDMNYPMPLEVQRVTGTTKVVWRASLYALSAQNTWVKVQTEGVHSVTGPWYAVNSSWMGNLNWDKAGAAYDSETLALPVGHHYFVAAETWWVGSGGQTLAYSNNWLTGCNA